MPPHGNSNKNWMPPITRSIKVVILGPAQCGKTALLNRFVDGVFALNTMSTIGVEFGIKNLTVNDQKIKLQIWDTTGNDLYRNIMTSYIPGTSVVLIAFDLTSKESIDLHYWLQLTKQHAPDAKIIIVGTKSVANTRAKEQELQALAHQNNLPCFITNAEDNINVNELFEEAAIQSLPKKVLQPALATKATLIAKLQAYITRIESNLLIIPTETTPANNTEHDPTKPLLTAHISSNPSINSPIQSVPIDRINFAHGFTYFGETQAANRKANYYLAKQLLDKLDPPINPATQITPEACTVADAFKDISAQRENLITEKKITGHTYCCYSWGVNSPTLTTIIAIADAIPSEASRLTQG